MKPGDLIAFKPENIPKGKKRKPIIFLGMTTREYAGATIEEYHIMDSKTGKTGQVPVNVIQKCEVIASINDADE